MIKAAIFDMDGVILDSMPIWENAVNLYLETLGIKTDMKLAEIMFAMTMDEGAEFLIKTFKLSKTKEEIFKGITEIVIYHYKNTIPLKPGVKEFIELIHKKSIKITLATASERIMVELAFERLGILKYFDKIFTATETGLSKTKPDMFFMAADFMNSVPGETWVFEDALHSVETAKSAGFKTVGIYDELSKKKQEALKEISDVYITSWDNPKEIFEKIIHKEKRK